MVGGVGEAHTAGQLAAIAQGQGEALGASAAVVEVPAHRALGHSVVPHLLGGGVPGVRHGEAGHLGHVGVADRQHAAVGVHGEVPIQGAADDLITQQGEAGLALRQGSIGILIPGAAGAGAGHDAGVDLGIAGLFPVVAHVHLELVVPAGADFLAALVQQVRLDLVIVSDAGFAGLSNCRREHRGGQ